MRSARRARHAPQSICTEPAALVTPTTAALESAIAQHDWARMIAISHDLLYLFQFTYPPLHPLVGTRRLAQGLAATQLGDTDAAALLTEASRVLTITHGPTHTLTLTAWQVLSSVQLG